MTTDAPITTPFSAQSTAAQVIAGIDLTGRRAIVTGGASGIGIETARALAGAGAEVTLAVRDVEGGQRVAEDLIGGSTAVAGRSSASRTNGDSRRTPTPP
jgi:NAD(P)-dependent dehydrogenase (short-subunit alcohol dehydrogenase family)